MATGFRASLLVTLTLIAISGNSPAFAGIKLEFIGEATFPTGFRFEDTEVGGLSGIDYDSTTRSFVAISDDRAMTVR